MLDAQAEAKSYLVFSAISILQQKIKKSVRNMSSS